MKTLYKDQVKHVAKLARLRLDEKEVDKYEVALNQILDEIEKIVARLRSMSPLYEDFIKKTGGNK